MVLERIANPSTGSNRFPSSSLGLPAKILKTNMQIWIYFLPGAGGDGLANLLEHADNVETIDSDQDPKCWRVHRFVDNQPKFYANPIDNIRCFRNNRPFLSAENQLKANYVRLVENNIPTVCTSHDVTKKYLHASDQRDILEHNQVSVYLYHPDFRRCVYQAALKNLAPELPLINSDDHYLVTKNIDIKQFDFVLNITEIQSNWSVLDQFCNTVGLNLNPDRFQEYCKLQAGDDEWYRPCYSSFHPKRYRSTTSDGNIFYTEI